MRMLGTRYRIAKFIAASVLFLSFQVSVAIRQRLWVHSFAHSKYGQFFNHENKIEAYEQTFIVWETYHFQKMFVLSSWHVVKRDNFSFLSNELLKSIITNYQVISQ